MLNNLNYIFKRSSDKMFIFIWWYFRMELSFWISHIQSLFKPLIDCWFYIYFTFSCIIHRLFTYFSLTNPLGFFKKGNQESLYELNSCSQLRCNNVAFNILYFISTFSPDGQKIFLVFVLKHFLLCFLLA